MLPFQKYHLLNFLNQLDQKSPLDLAMSKYFRNHRALGKNDRKYIAESSYAIIRWLKLIDYFIKGNKSWQQRLETYEGMNFADLVKDCSIPEDIRASCPTFLFNKLKESLGEKEAFDLALKFNKRAPFTLRINTLKTSREQFMDLHKDELPMEKCEQSLCGVRLLEHKPLFKSEAFKQGLFEVQDEASQLAAKLVEAKPKQKILDYCSGSGGKSLAIAPHLEHSGCLFLHDIRPHILGEAKKRMKRAGVFNYQIVFPNSKKLNMLKNHMDWVLVDAPCSGSGTLRRNPDLKWKINADMIEQITALQRKIVQDAIQYLKPNGHLVYVTCSVLADENIRQVEYFTKHLGLKLVNMPLNSANEFDRMDGFYGAVLTRE